MNILSLFVIIPVVMMVLLFLENSKKAIRATMATGSSLMVILAFYIAYSFLTQRQAGANAAYLFTASQVWYQGFLNINYSVGIDGISVAMLAAVVNSRNDGLVCLIRHRGPDQGVLPLVSDVVNRCVRLLHFHQPLHHGALLRGGTDTNVSADWPLGYRP
jgi:hypothetical protein